MILVDWPFKESLFGEENKYLYIRTQIYVIGETKISVYGSTSCKSKVPKPTEQQHTQLSVKQRVYLQVYNLPLMAAWLLGTLDS